MPAEHETISAEPRKEMVRIIAEAIFETTDEEMTKCEAAAASILAAFEKRDWVIVPEDWLNG